MSMEEWEKVFGGYSEKPKAKPRRRLTAEQVILIRDNPDGLTINQLAERYGVGKRTISAIQLGKKHKDVGGKIRGVKKSRVPDEIRAKIRAEYQRGVYGHGKWALAKKYGVDSATVLNIIRE